MEQTDKQTHNSPAQTELWKELDTLEQQLTAAIDQLGQYHRTSIQLALQIAEIHLALGDHKSALEKCAQVKQLSREGLYEGHGLYLSALCLTARVYDLQGDTDCAEDLRSRAIEYLHSRGLRTSRDIGIAIELAGSMGSAANTREFLIDLMQNVSIDQLPEDTKQLLFARMGLLYKQSYELEEAARFFDALWSTEIEDAQVKDMSVPEALHAFALLKADEEDYFDAMEILEKARSLCLKLNASNLELQILNELGSLAELLEKFDAAASFFEQVVEQNERLHGTYHESTTMALIRAGQFFYQQGELENAARYLERALYNLEQLEQKPQQLIAEQHHNLGIILYAQGNNTEALQHIEEAVAIRSSTLGKDTEETALSLLALATLHKAINNLEEARRYLQEAVEILEKIKGVEAPDYKEARRILDEISSPASESESQFQATAEEKLATKPQPGPAQAQVSTRASNGSLNFEESVKLFNEATVASGSGDFRKAFALLQKVLPSFETTFSKESPELLPVLQQLEAAAYAIGNISCAQDCYRRIAEIKKS